MFNPKLKQWQQIVIDNIDDYDDYIGEQSLVGYSNYEKNHSAKIQIKLRKREGHSTLTGLIATKYPSLVIYWDWAHCKELEHLMEFNKGESFNSSTEFLSVKEIRHDLLLSGKSDAINLAFEHLKTKFNKDKKVIVIDKASEVLEKWPEIIDFICKTAENSAIVLLG